MSLRLQRVVCCAIDLISAYLNIILLEPVSCTFSVLYVGHPVRESSTAAASGNTGRERRKGRQGEGQRQLCVIWGRASQEP